MEILNPKFGCMLIAPVDDFQAEGEMVPENVSLVSLGFDTAKLDAAINGLRA
jgi:hypothetical protein